MSSFPDKLGVSAAETLLFYATNPLLPRESDCTTNGPLDLSSPYPPGAPAGGSTGVKPRPGELCCPLSSERADSFPPAVLDLGAQPRLRHGWGLGGELPICSSDDSYLIRRLISAQSAVLISRLLINVVNEFLL